MHPYDFSISCFYLPSSLFLKGWGTESHSLINWSQASDTAGVPGRSKGQIHSRERFPQVQDIFLKCSVAFWETFSNCLLLLFKFILYTVNIQDLISYKEIEVNIFTSPP